MLLLLVCSSGACAVPMPILDYRFDDRTYTYTGATKPGSGAASFGSDATPLGFRNNNNLFPAGNGQSVNYVDFLASSNNGVSGRTGDHALQMDAVTMGDVENTNAQTADAVSALNGLTSLTVTGWFKTRTTTPLASNTRLVRNKSTKGFSVHADVNNPAALTLEVDAQTAVSDAAVFNVTQSWVFFAVRYDGTITTNNVAFFMGTQTTAATQVGSLISANAGTLGSSPQYFSVGQGDATPRVFDGFLDDIKVFGATSGNAAALSLADIESIRQADLVPEPSSIGLIGCAVAGVLSRRKRH